MLSRRTPLTKTSLAAAQPLSAIRVLANSVDTNVFICSSGEWWGRDVPKHAAHSRRKRVTRSLRGGYPHGAGSRLGATDIHGLFACAESSQAERLRRRFTAHWARHG